MKALLLLVAALGTAQAVASATKTVPVEVTIATHYTDGTLLPARSAWTIVNQYAGQCPVLTNAMPIGGKGFWNGELTTVVWFQQLKGTCACYDARTLVWTDTVDAWVSVATTLQKCLPAAVGCETCHQ